MTTTNAFATRKNFDDKIIITPLPVFIIVAFTLSFVDKKNIAITDYFNVKGGWNVNKIEKDDVHTYKIRFINVSVIKKFPLTLKYLITDMLKKTNSNVRVIGKVPNISTDVLILDENGNTDVGKLEQISYEHYEYIYRVLGKKVGNTFQYGLQTKNK